MFSGKSERKYFCMVSLDLAIKLFLIGLIFISVGLNAGSLLSRGRGSVELVGTLFEREDYICIATDWLPSRVSRSDKKMPVPLRIGSVYQKRDFSPNEIPLCLLRPLNVTMGIHVRPTVTLSHNVLVPHRQAFGPGLSELRHSLRYESRINLGISGRMSISSINR